MLTLLRDLRFAFRQLARAPGFSLIAVLTLGLGIGAISALFNIVNALLFRPPGYRDPKTLVDVYQTSPGFRYGTTSYPDYADLRDQNSVFDGVALYQLQSLGFSRSDQSRSVWAEVVSGNYFTVLGVQAQVGRLFQPKEDDIPGASPIVVLSHAFWQREFGRDPRVVGTTVRLNGSPFQVVGVAAPEFHGMVRGLIPGVWVPAAMTDRLFPGSSFLTERGNHNSFMRARLKPGVTAVQAATNATAISQRLAETYPASNVGHQFVVVPTSDVVVNPSIDGMISGAALGILAVPALVLLIVCANLATLFLTRHAGRRREIAVRLALGAARRQVVRQLVVESLLIALAGGALGLGLCIWLSDLLMRFQPPTPVPLSLDIQMDWRVILFTAGVAISTAVLFGLAPALRATRPNLSGDLREGGRGSIPQSRLRAGLVVAQLAVSVILVVGSGLLLQGLAGAARVDLGFVPGQGATLSFDPKQQGYDDQKTFALFRELRERLKRLPQVKSVSYATRTPLSLNISSNEIMTEGHDPGPGHYPEIQRSTVGPEYVATIGGRLASGRDFTEDDDRNHPRVVLANESAARLLWPNENPIGKRLASRNSKGPGTWLEVIGVVKDIKVTTVGETPTPQLFFPLYQSGNDSYVALIARTTGEPAVLVGELRRALKDLDATMPIMSSGVLDELVTTALFPIRFTALLLVALGAVGLLISAIGLYGIIAQNVAARTRELGIRMALGAKARDVQAMVLRQGLRLSVVGLGLGLLIAAFGSRLLRSWLYGISPLDPLSFSVAPIALLAIAAVACLIPARRATQVDPVEALRAE